MQEWRNVGPAPFLEETGPWAGALRAICGLLGAPDPTTTATNAAPKPSDGHHAVRPRVQSLRRARHSHSLNHSASHHRMQLRGSPFAACTSKGRASFRRLVGLRTLRLVVTCFKRRSLRSYSLARLYCPDWVYFNRGNTGKSHRGFPRRPNGLNPFGHRVRGALVSRHSNLLASPLNTLAGVSS